VRRSRRDDVPSRDLTAWRGHLAAIRPDAWIPTPDEQFESLAPHQWQSPSAWWPDDRAWATSNDTDLDSTLVGGSRALVDDLLADERLEVLPWPVDGSLWAGADTINA
jgi:hypothetical protein